MSTLLDDELEFDEDLLADAFAPSFNGAGAPPPSPPIDALPENKDNGARPANAPDSVKAAAQGQAGTQAQPFDAQSFLRSTPDDEAEVLSYKQALAQARQGRMAADIGQLGNDFASKLLGTKPSTDFWQRQRDESQGPLETLRALSGVRAGQLAQKQKLAAGAVNQMNALAAAQNAANTTARNALYQKELEARAKKLQAEIDERAASTDATSDTSRVAQDRYLESLPAEERGKWEPIVRRTPAKDLPGFEAIAKRGDKAQEAAAKARKEEADRAAKAALAERDRQFKAQQDALKQQAKTTGTPQAPAGGQWTKAEERRLEGLITLEGRTRAIEADMGDLRSLVVSEGPTEAFGSAGGKMKQFLTSIATNRAKAVDPSSAAMWGEVETQMKQLWDPESNKARVGLSKQTALELMDNLLALTQRATGIEYNVRGFQRPTSGSVFDATRLPPKAQTRPPDTKKTYKVDFGGGIGVREVTEDKLQAALRKQGARLVE